jgi:hypothetical protein
MRSLVIGAFMALFLFVPVSHANHAPVPMVCKTTEADFLLSAKNMNAKQRVATPKAKEALLTAINAERSKAGQWAFEADNFMIGVIVHKGKLLIGTVMFKDHCVVPGTVHVFNADEFVAFIVGLGLSMDDFVATNPA